VNFISESIMKVASIDGNLAVCLPPAVVDVLGLKEGDDVEIHINGDRSLDIEVTNRRLRALETLRSLQRPFPPDFKFDREEANAR
jgi:antitoxin MazE